MKRVKISIDADHAKKLMAGKPVAIKVPAGTEVIEIQFGFPATHHHGDDSIAKIFDVFFNGRPA